MKTGFAGLLTILFIGLKLTGYIDWPWILVLAPMWFGFVLLICILLIIAMVGGTVEINSDKKR